MKRVVIFGVSLLLSFTVLAQKKSPYFQFDFAIPLRVNPNMGETDELWFLPDGIAPKLGYGIQYKGYLAIGIHSGIEWKWTEQLVAVPIYGNIRLSPKIGEDTRLNLQMGLGKGFALGRGNLSGTYKKMNLGITSDDVTLFVEISQYNIVLHNQKAIGSISLGISVMSY
jgi:hypothetical protein